MTTWRRAHPLGRSSSIGLGFVVIGVGFTTVMTFRFVAGGGHWVANPVLGILMFYGFLLLWTGFAWRMYRTGIYVSDEAVRIVHPWRNRVVAWSDVAQFSSQPAMLGGLETIRNAIFLRLRNGKMVETPVQRQASRFAGGIHKNIGPVLNQVDFDATLAFLRGMLDRTTSPRRR